jgi:hypothetical protein
MHKQDEHESLHGLVHRSVIPYIHERESCIAVCVTLFKAELYLRKVEVLLYSRLPMLFIAQSTG